MSLSTPTKHGGCAVFFAVAELFVILNNKQYFESVVAWRRQWRRHAVLLTISSNTVGRTLRYARRVDWTSSAEWSRRP